MVNLTLEQIAQHYEQAATELEQAAQHLRVTADHFRRQEIPRGCAHAFAGYGHLCNAQDRLKELAIIHAAHSEPQP